MKEYLIPIPKDFKTVEKNGKTYFVFEDLRELKIVSDYFKEKQKLAALDAQKEFDSTHQLKLFD